MENSEGVYKAVDLIDTGYTAIFEDDGKTAYGYLLLNGKIIADVWLYNCNAAPDRPEWPDASKAPFLNPKEYVHDIKYVRIEEEDGINFEWYRDKETGEAAVEIYLRGELFGRLQPGSKPGWSRLAKKDGPVAQRLAR